MRPASPERSGPMREDHCSRCGYLSEWHDVARRCPGMKTGTWTARDPIDGALWPEILKRDMAARRQADVPVEPEPHVPPLVPARAPRGSHEFAAGQGRQAAGLGRLAARLGFDVAPYYWKSGAGVEGCAVKGFRAVPSLAFVATWQRKPGVKGWATDAAYAWRPEDRTRAPTKLTVTQLEEIIRGG